MKKNKKRKTASGCADLSLRQRRFVDEFAVDGVATKAAIRAGYSPNGAAVQASRLLTKPNILAAVNAAEAARSQRVKYDADQALRDLIPLCSTNVKNFIVDGEPISLAQISALPDDVAAQITSIKTTTRYDTYGNEITEVDLKLHDRVKAVSQAGRHRAVQAWSEQVEVSHNFGNRMDEIAARLGVVE